MDARRDRNNQNLSGGQIKTAGKDRQTETDMNRNTQRETQTKIDKNRDREKEIVNIDTNTPRKNASQDRYKRRQKEASISNTDRKKRSEQRKKDTDEDKKVTRTDDKEKAHRKKREQANK